MQYTKMERCSLVLLCLSHLGLNVFNLFSCIVSVLTREDFEAISLYLPL